LQPLVSAPQPPASAVPLPVSTAGRDLSPVAPEPNPAQSPTWQQVMPVPQPARAPHMSNAPLREPQPVELSALSKEADKVTADPEPVASVTALPELKVPEPPAPPMAGLADYAKFARSRMTAIAGTSKTVASSVQEQISLPGPTLPHELTSLDAAGVARILVSAAGQVEPVAAKSSSWLVSFMVAAAVLAGTLGASFYAMPGLANSSAPKKERVVKEARNSVPEPEKPKAPENPFTRIVEVTGVRFVTDIPGRSPQIHYLVVNHSNLPLAGVTVNVTLKDASADVPLSQFAFRAPRLGPYESKEMVSSIERFNKPISLPDWRALKTEIEITQ